MERQRKARLIIIFLLTTAVSSSSQNRYEFTTIDIDSTSGNPVIIDYSLRPTNTATPFQDSTTYLPAISASIKTDEVLDSSETNVLSRYAQSSYGRNEQAEEDDDLEEVSDHVIPYSVHEEARDVPTRPRYVAPGYWATPPPEKNIPLDFVPMKLHAQVRGTHTVKRLPRREAIESAETDEEKLNAHRLREVVTNSKVNTIYTEEGYEDSAYDHAGHVRDADFHEGYARKLHDQQKNSRNSSSGKNRSSRHSNLVPDEFEEYDEDYQDHVKENRKHGDDEDNLIGYGGNTWEGSEVDPKLVAETGIQKLEEDTEKEAEENERTSKLYQNAQESKFRNDVDSSESEDSEDDLKVKENKSITKKKKADTSLKINGKKSHKSDRKKKLYDGNYGTTISQPSEMKTSLTDTEVSATPRSFVTNPSITQVYSTDGTTQHFVAPIDEPTTINYSQLFWDYFKAKQSPSSTETSDSTTMNPQPEERTPIAVATIDGHGPYLLITKEEATRMPSTFFDSFYPELSSDSVKFGSNYNRHLLGHIDDVDFANASATATVATSPNKKPDLLQSSSSGPENVEHSSPTSLLDKGVTSTSTPTVMIFTNITKEALSKLDDYMENPYLGPLIDKSNVAFLKNKMKYKVLVRPEPKKSAKPGEQSSRQQASSPLVSQQEKKHNRIRDELSEKYNKVLSHIKSKQALQSSPEKKKATHADFDPMRPPAPQRIAYSIFPINRPADHPSVSIASESPWEAAKKGLSQDQKHRPQAIKSKPYRFDPFVYVQPVRLLYHRNAPLPATKLLPPPPPSIADTHGNNRSSRQNGYHLSHVSGKSQQQQQQQQRDSAFKYLPFAPEATWKTRSRKKRSDEFRDAVVDVKAAANNSMTNGGETQRDEDTTRSAFLVRDSESGASAALERRTTTAVNSESEKDVRKPTIDSSTLVDGESLLRAQRNARSGKGHEDLLSESPKISGAVIDKEIAARFNDNDKNDDETSAEIEEEKKVEAEVPSFDYVEELADEKVPEPSTTTEAAVDSKKYPFYTNDDVPSASALKYVVDPKTIPRKTSSGMEFYDSRNAYKQCDEVEPDLDEVLPEKEEPDPEREPPENLPRLRGLGDKLDCFKAKYFDENPLDNPLFAEKLIGNPTPPTELNPAKFASKILVLPETDDDYVVHQMSKKPERNGRQLRNRNRPHETQESIRVNYKHDPRTGRGRNAYLHTVRGSRPPLRRLKGQRSRPKSPSGTTTQSPKLYQTESYQNQVYEDVMGNIRSMASSYQVYEMTTILPAQILATAGSENTVKIADVAPSSSSREKTTLLPNDTDISTMKYESTMKSSEIKGLVPPPMYLTPQQTGYRKHRPSGKSRVLMRSSNIPRIIAHHHTIKINKRSAINDTARDSFENIDKNNTVVQSVEETTNETTFMPETLDLETEESRQIRTQNQDFPTTLKVDDKKKRRNFTNSDRSNGPPQRTVYTIKDRVRNSKPKWDTRRGFGKFSTKPQTTDEDNRRKEPRYNYLRRKKKPVDDQNNYTTLKSADGAPRLTNAPSLVEDEKSSTTEIYRAEESVVHRAIYHGDAEYQEPGSAESTVDAKSKKNAEEEAEGTTNTYKVHEDVEEDSLPTTTKSANSKDVADLRDYVESNPPGYEKTFSEENYPKTETSVSNEDSFEKVEEQVETPTRTRSSAEDDDSEELVSKEEEGSNKKQSFFNYVKRPSSVEHDDESTERTFYPSFPFPRYKSRPESDEDESREKSAETSEDYVFPWHADREHEGDKHKWLKNFDRFEYPWERRERLARERRNKQKRANRFKKMIFDDDDEEYTRRERPVYAWEKYDVPSKPRANTRRDISRNFSRRNIEEDSEEYTTEQAPPRTVFSSGYSSTNVQPTKSSSAREISKSIRKVLEEDNFSEDASKEGKDSHSSEIKKSSSSFGKGISRGTLVPEDITQPPRKRDKKRKKILLPVKNVTDNSDFDSKKLENKEISDKANEEEYLAVDYSKLRKINISDTETQIAATTYQPSELFNSTKEVPAATTEPRKKRRRKLFKNNSTISVDNAAAESVAELATKRRRKPQVTTTTTTSVTPLASIDLAVSRSFFTPVRGRYSKTGEIVKTNELDPLKEMITVKTAPETATFDRLRVNTSTPKTRTIEHRLRVSKQKIVTKTVYPNEADNFNFTKINATFDRKQEEEKVKPKVRRRKKTNKQNDDNMYDDNKNLNSTEKFMEQEKRENADAESVSEDKIKKLISRKPQDQKSFEVQQEAEKKINDFNDGNINDENDNTNGEMMSETHAVKELLQNISPNRQRNGQANERTESESNINEDWNKRSEEADEKDRDAEEKRRSLLQTKFIKNPERRLYYYIERK